MPANFEEVQYVTFGCKLKSVCIVSMRSANKANIDECLSTGKYSRMN